MSLHRLLSRSVIFSSAGGRSLLRSPSAAFSTDAPSRTRRPRSSAKAPPQRLMDGERLFCAPERKALRRPSEVPFQPQVANSVHFVGKVAAPVQIQKLPDGTASAVSALIYEQALETSSQLWIPVVFHGDLADIAACYLRENDSVYVTGQLSCDVPISSVKGEQTNVQILAHTLCYVQEDSSKTKDFLLPKQVEVASKYPGEVEEQTCLPIQKEWDDLANPHKGIPTSIDFKHVANGQSLRVNKLTPELVRSKFDSLSFSSASGTSWSNLVSNPEKWRDYRTDKKHGSVKPRYPDFKHTDSGEPLWLDNKTPAWVLEQLDSLEFSPGIRTKQVNLWESLAKDPSKWWDNRLKKLKETSPDFKHKETGDALWIDKSTPSSILDKLPGLK